MSASDKCPFCAVFGSTFLNPCPPSLPWRRLQFSAHQHDNFFFRKSKLRFNGIKRRAVFPGHFNDAVQSALVQVWIIYFRHVLSTSLEGCMFSLLCSFRMYRKRLNCQVLIISQARANILLIVLLTRLSTLNIWHWTLSIYIILSVRVFCFALVFHFL